MIIRREQPGDDDPIRRVHRLAFARPDTPDEDPVEAGLVDDLRVTPDWIPQLSLVALAGDEIIGHVVCTRGRLGNSSEPVLGLGPLGVTPEHQRQRVGHALMHGVLGAADALNEPLVALLGDPNYYRRFGFVDARLVGVEAPEPAWGEHFQVRALATYHPALTGVFAYAAPFAGR
ncbi:MAG: GNAT family N-acetyltransferase [Acidimicrobiia bacterium]